MDKTIKLVGNAHLDPIWLWRWQEGCAEVLQTFRSALDRLKEYNDFVFTCSSAAYYKWVEEIDPQMFEEIRVMVKPEVVNDQGMILIAKDIAKKIESELEYPGQIRVSLIRETRAVDFAK